MNLREYAEASEAITGKMVSQVSEIIERAREELEEARLDFRTALARLNAAMRGDDEEKAAYEPHHGTNGGFENLRRR